MRRTLFCLLAAATLMLSPQTGRAHHTKEHLALVTGVRADFFPEIAACWEIGAAANLLLAARKSQESFNILYTLFRSATAVTPYGYRDVVCGPFFAGKAMLPLEKLYEEDIRGVHVTMFAFVSVAESLTDGTMTRVILFGLTTVPVVSLGEYLGTRQTLK